MFHVDSGDHIVENLQQDIVINQGRPLDLSKQVKLYNQDKLISPNLIHSYHKRQDPPTNLASMHIIFHPFELPLPNPSTLMVAQQIWQGRPPAWTKHPLQCSSHDDFEFQIKPNDF